MFVDLVSQNIKKIFIIIYSSNDLRDPVTYQYELSAL